MGKTVLDASGIRTSKKFDNFTTKFYLDGTKILRQEDSCNTITFFYGADGVTGFHIKSMNALYNGTPLDHDFFYRKNAQNDVIGILDSNRQEIVKYSYDAWGNQKIQYLTTENSFDFVKSSEYTTTDPITKFIAVKNPFRYRSYYYDFETGLYYLNSRYYDPETGRFVNADDVSILSESQEFINGLNLYVYCNNNPVNLVDENGYAWWHWLLGIGLLAIAGIAVIATAGGFLAGASAIVAVASGGSAATISSTISAGIFVGASTMFVAYGIIAGIDSISTLANGGTFDAALNIYSNYGESAMWSTISGGAVGVLTAALAWHEHNPKMHSWTTEARRYWKNHGKTRTPIGNDGYSMQLHHPYGRSGAGFYVYYPMTRTEHINLHKLIGYKHFALVYPYTNFWDIFKPLMYILGVSK